MMSKLIEQPTAVEFDVFDDNAFDKIILHHRQSKVNKIVDVIDAVIKKGEYKINELKDGYHIVISDKGREKIGDVIPCISEDEIYEVRRVYALRNLLFKAWEERGCNWHFEFCKGNIKEGDE